VVKNKQTNFLSNECHRFCFRSKNSSAFDQEPNYTGLKKTGERQECVGLAVLPGGTVCMNDWFCTWSSYFICEIRKNCIFTHNYVRFI